MFLVNNIKNYYEKMNLYFSLKELIKKFMLEKYQNKKLN